MAKNFISNLSGPWLESLYETWQRDNTAVAEEWQHFFSGFELGRENGAPATPGVMDEAAALKQSGVQSLIYRYRNIGHLLACTDPLSPCLLEHPLLLLSEFGLGDDDLDTRFTARRFIKQSATLREIVATLRESYCREIGVEFMHIQEPAERQWLIDRMEPRRNRPNLSPGERLHILEKLHEAALFESFLQRRFPGQKRFSLEGGDVLIPVLDAVRQACPAAGISDLVLGMAHRGRLNVLAHIFGKPYEDIFAEFRDTMEFGFLGDGDVKYHKGYSADIELPGGKLHLTLTSNPSHLEAVNPVVEGKCRARQTRYGEGGAQRVLPLLIHGDAAFAGQGSIMEVLNMSQLEGYGTGGTIHVVLNNQIGFTTLPKDARSTRYATDVAKMLACPIFHVQGEAPETAVHAARLALEYRQAFGRDVVLELICYRRHGHNEGDEPAFTQPLMYRKITARPTVNRIYADTLAEAGLDATELAGIEQGIATRLDNALQTETQATKIGFQQQWSDIARDYAAAASETGVPGEKLVALARSLVELPPGFTPHAKILTLIKKRFEAVTSGTGLDWGNAETLAYATLLDEGMPVRLSGQDSRRGTFNHRHCVLHDTTTGASYTPLATTARGGATFQAWDSLLSEFGVLGFEYGYSLETPNGLVIWEAQFGDFANGAQVIIDQFIASGETKWNRASGLVMLLPHGYEGQGAEHSSARIERYLQLCARENMVVATPSTPAQMFHLLRRQLKQPFRKPLIVFTPKSLLRHPSCVSSLDELQHGGFQEVILDSPGTADVTRVLACSGKIYYELVEERDRLGRSDTAIVRIEQLYPLRGDLLGKIVGALPPGVRFSWVQEEPENMGAWPYLRRYLTEAAGAIRYVGRPEDSCPAVGSHRIHADEQKAVISAAFAD
ncbi:2-oxoglutarate dehydrogenase E1 component [Oryzomonas sagensis]|uniref:oxoglutarate dehydrogenase (succinyl-transferring) n=1 Tax=Oryzomonas sagensis TaxID=2603857 RepID=A0ABQ6TLT9_9BACT|nr:2-oxoglutarate dehydrogenase E1 component [Oryzomonas sagensis]KAB0669411.1 2-oxoglutarate dehydrogenase E1 component [Oryzomonas sagensis]